MEIRTARVYMDGWICGQDWVDLLTQLAMGLQHRVTIHINHKNP